MEIWKPIKDYEHSYEVSNLGYVRSVDGRELAQHIDDRGYRRVRLDGKQHRVHRLVAIAFIPNPDDRKQVRHKDGDRTDNMATNLAWSSLEDFIKMDAELGRTGKRNNFMAKSRSVSCFTKDLIYKGTYVSIQEASRATNTPAPNIHKVLTGAKKTANALVFRYAKDDDHVKTAMQ